MKAKQGVVLLLIAALVFIATAFAHLTCIYFGPQCYAAQMAPNAIVESAKSGTLLAPLGTIFVSAVFVVFACYGLSGAKIIRRLPLLSIGIYSIAVVCIIRGLLPLQLWLRHPSKVSGLVLAVGIVWLSVGVFYWMGFRAMQDRQNP